MIFPLMRHLLKDTEACQHQPEPRLFPRLRVRVLEPGRTHGAAAILIFSNNSAFVLNRREVMPAVGPQRLPFVCLSAWITAP